MVRYKNIDQNIYKDIDSIGYTDTSKSGRTTAYIKALKDARTHAIKSRTVIGIIDNEKYLGRVVPIDANTAMYAYFEKGDIQIKRVCAYGKLAKATDAQLFRFSEVLITEF